MEILMKNTFPNKDTQFSSENQPENRGRKKKIYTVISELGYSADDIRTSFGELAFYTLKELKDVHDDESKPIVLRIIANQFFMALKKSDWNKIKEILEHVIGKPQANVDLNITQESPDLSNLTYEQLLKLRDGSSDSD